MVVVGVVHTYHKKTWMRTASKSNHLERPKKDTEKDTPCTPPLGDLEVKKDDVVCLCGVTAGRTSKLKRLSARVTGMVPYHTIPVRLDNGHILLCNQYDRMSATFYNTIISVR